MIELCGVIINEIDSYRGKLGNHKLPALYPVSSNVPQGMAVAALPSGRRAWRPLADGCSPSQGQDRLGPTASCSLWAKCRTKASTAARC